jgi:hypothetical protein
MTRHAIVQSLPLALVLWALAACAAAQDASPPPNLLTLTASGLAATQGKETAAARNAAIEDACRNAVEQACGVYVTGATRVGNFELVSDVVLTHASGYVRHYEVLEESQQEGVYRVTISAEVDVGAVQDYASYSVLVGDFAGPSGEEAKAVADAFSTMFAGSSRYQVLERTPVRTATAAALVAGAGVFSEEECRRVAKQLGARLLVAGSYAPRGREVTLSARLIDLATGTVVPRGSASMTGPDANLFYLAGQLANRLHVNLTGLWLRGTSAQPAGQTTEEALHQLESLDPTLMLAGSGAPFGLEVTLDRGANATYRDGDALALRVKSERDCYLTIYNLDARGRVTLLFPNGYQTDSRVSGGEQHLVPAPAASWELRVGGEPGVESIQVIASGAPLALCAPEAFAESPFPSLSDDAGEFLAKSVMPQLKEQERGKWTAAVVKFLHAPAASSLESGLE